MLGAGSEFEKGGFMSSGAVADVFFKSVARVFFGEVGHIAIAGDFGDNRGGTDFFDEKVGFREESDFVSERSVREKVDGAVNDNFVELQERGGRFLVWDGSFWGDGEVVWRCGGAYGGLDGGVVLGDLGEDLFDGAARSEFQGGTEPVAVDFGGGHPAEAGSSSVF